MTEDEDSVSWQGKAKSGSSFLKERPEEGWNMPQITSSPDALSHQWILD
jgi:hypothetical protein